MPNYEIALKRIEYGYAIVQAKNEEEAKTKAKNHESKEKFFPEQDLLIAPNPIEIKPEDEY